MNFVPSQPADLQTPALQLDAAKMRRNISRLRERLGQMAPHVRLRPHLKTAKSIPVARLMQPDLDGPVTVSTLKEADEFAAAGYRDMLYAVGIVPSKYAHMSRLIDQGVKLTVILDSVQAAQQLAAYATQAQQRIPVLIEIDTDGQRSGVRPGDAQLVQMARSLEPACELRGVMTHAGASYASFSLEDKQTIAEQERAGAVLAAQTLRQAGFAAPVVSVGSTPTALFARHLEGVTEVRAGVYVFFDLVMSGLGVCEQQDIALSVLASVIGHQPQRGQIIVDAGWMAMSRDRGTASHPVDQGYGLVCDLQGRVLTDLIMSAANQEHGILSLRPGSEASLPELPVGSLVRILPNHACATAAQHDSYMVLEDGAVVAQWARFRGW